MRYLVIFTSLVLALCMLCSFLPAKSDMRIYDDIVRLHIIAASDSDDDQRLKEGVRDAVLPLLADASEQAKNAKEAELFLSATLDAVRETAENYLRANGCDYPVS
ncbi:MAG: stage II sporulation protein R, partial [Eubacteriales bacterium]